MELVVTTRVAGASTPAAPAHQGTGLGLANVCDRLEAHFGKRADCRFGPVVGGYEVSLGIPVDDDD
jgi:LytS/YehU family sensor histidine kinase